MWPESWQIGCLSLHLCAHNALHLWSQSVVGYWTFLNSKMCSNFSCFRDLRIIGFSIFVFALSTMKIIFKKAYSYLIFFLLSPPLQSKALPSCNLLVNYIHQYYGCRKRRNFPFFPISMWFLMWLFSLMILAEPEWWSINSFNIFIKHLLCAQHCARHDRITESKKTYVVSVLVELPV